MLAVSNAVAVGWACFVLGGVMFLVGFALGVYLAWKEADDAARANVKAKVEEAVAKVSDLTSKAVDAANKEGKDSAAAAAASTTGGSTVDTIKDFEGLLKVLPERLRFSGFLTLIGALLMSVATVQFGGHSIF